jgi:hypothetical protein
MGCSSDRGSSLVDYTTVSAATPPKELRCLWAGRHSGGVLFVEIFSDGVLRSCLSAPPYQHRLAGKYSNHALYLEDGTRIEIKTNDAHAVTVYSPPGRPIATLVSDSGGQDALRCFADNDTGGGAI